MSNLSTKEPTEKTPNVEAEDVQHMPPIQQVQKPEDNSLDSLVKFLSCTFAFFVAGINDGSVGPLIPYFIRDYQISTAVVSILYAANFTGWLLAALTNTHIHASLDLGAILLLGSFLQVLGNVLRAWKPPVALLIVTFSISSLGQAYQDTHSNTFVAGIKGKHRWLSMIHAMYTAGTFVGPFVSTAMASAGSESRWWLFYWVPFGLSVGNFVVVCVAFRDTIKFRTTRKAFAGGEDPTPSTLEHRSERQETNTPNGGAWALVRTTFRLKAFWLLSLFYFFYLGSVLTAGGWLVEYLVDVRHGDLSTMGYVASAFTGGSLLGRLFLGEVVHRFGARKVIFGFSVLAVGFQLVFWLVPSIIASAVAVCFLGLVTGPFFAAGVATGSLLFDDHSKSTALGFVFVFAQMGGCLFPIVTGVVSASRGVASLQPILCALLVATSISWLLVPRPKTHTYSK